MSAAGSINALEVTKKVTLCNRRGLHARASNKFMKCVMEFDAEVTVTSHNETCAETVVAESVMELILLGAACCEDITIAAKGPQAEQAVEALADLVASRFGEDA